MFNNKYILIFLFGGLGTIIRTAITSININNFIHITILICNIIGSFLIGYINSKVINKSLKIGLCTGLCGGLTTMSAFSLAYFRLIQENIVNSMIYVLISVILCFLAVILGEKVSVFRKGDSEC
jgi:CrcB protein